MLSESFDSGPWETKNKSGSKQIMAIHPVHYPGWNISKIFLHSSPNTKMTVTYKPKNIEPTIKTGNENLSNQKCGSFPQSIWRPAAVRGAELCNLRCQGRWAGPKPKSQDWLWVVGHHCVYIVSGPHWSLNCTRAGEKQTALDWKMALPLVPIGNSQSRSIVLTLGKNLEMVLDS